MVRREESPAVPPVETDQVHGRVLIVEDEPLNRRILEQILGGSGLETESVRDGEGAIEAAIRGGIDLVLLDIVLPGINGFEVLRRLRTSRETRALPVIFISALDDVADKIRGLDLGAADYVAKPFNRHEVLARVRAQLRIRHLTTSLARANAQLVAKQEIIAEDLRAAAEVQRALLPPLSIRADRLELASVYQPSIEVGGDAFNVFHAGDGIWIVYIADVSGHGVASALLTVSITQRLSGPAGLAIGGRVSPASILRQLDEEYPFERTGKYFSLAIAIVDVGTGSLRYASAGHPAPFIVRADGSIERLEEGGPIIGMGFDLAFSEGNANLGTGDRLVLYTDGVTEDEDPSGRRFGMPALEEHFSSRIGVPLRNTCDELVDRLRRHRHDQPPADDITLVAMEREPRG